MATLYRSPLQDDRIVLPRLEVELQLQLDDAVSEGVGHDASCAGVCGQRANTNVVETHRWIASSTSQERIDVGEPVERMIQEVKGLCTELQGFRLAHLEALEKG